MRLMGIAKGIETRRPDLLDAGPDLFAGEGMAVTDAVFVSGDAVDEDRRAVEQEGMSTGLMQVGPVDRADAVGCRYAIDEPAVAREAGDELIEIGSVGAPKMGLGDGGELLAYGDGLIGIDALCFAFRGDDFAFGVDQLLSDNAMHRCRAVIL